MIYLGHLMVPVDIPEGFKKWPEDAKITKATASSTPTVDPTIPIEDATLFVADFESGIPPEIRGLLHRWETRLDADDNSV